MEHFQNSIDLYVKRCTQRRSECRQVWEDLSLKKEWFSKEFHWLSMAFEGNVIHIEWMGHCSVDDNDMALSVITLAQVGRAYSTLCVCVCVCYHKIAVQAQLSQNLNKLHLTNLVTLNKQWFSTRQAIVLTGKRGLNGE